MQTSGKASALLLPLEKSQRTTVLDVSLCSGESRKKLLKVIYLM